MNLDSLIRIVNHKLRENQNRSLNSAEILIIRGIWHYQTYSRIAEEGGYSTGYLTNVVAPELFQRLSALIGQRITKKNCRLLLESYGASQTVSVISIQKQSIEFPSDTNQEYSPRYPSGSVPLNSSFYLERSFIDEQVYAEIRKPGALVRIKAPREMGKTSLILRALDYAERQGYCTVSLNLEQTDQAILSNLNRFLRWLCANVTSQLDFDAKLDDYWDEDIGSKVSCSLYFRNCLLERIDSPLVLVLDEAHHIFEYPQVAKDFLPLLRSWYEEAKRLAIWQKLRLIIVHSTEIYVPLQLQQSPFNVGLPVQLTCFTLKQVQQLAQRYGLEWTDGKEAKQLMDMVGGHPALVNIALYHLNRGEITLPQLLKTAPTSTGIYVHHLQRHWATLQKQPELAIALSAVMSTREPVLLEPITAYKLSSMGLIKLANNKATFSCQLYRHYFQRDFLPEERQILV
ncbi:AAA-like domain-containing protein [Nostocaceae cyanobacterium CENA357]|uniref:AAA-like domain-containing protein n=1 Tax=Atlanticothrix silvestris CENA357 TaxID=1725252 RepID=A0A8J7HGC3_9CYAN|nr:AAA-like domain-containing protein [Atlanticothrix silvestris]MBH8552510.1 AAA-like domain-containing protein [Atlanticothrix silvestris CENA357]